MPASFTEEELATYHREGFFVVRQLFSRDEIAKLRQFAENLYMLSKNKVLYTEACRNKAKTSLSLDKMLEHYQDAIKKVHSL